MSDLTDAIELITRVTGGKMVADSAFREALDKLMAGVIKTPLGLLCPHCRISLPTRSHMVEHIMDVHGRKKCPHGKDRDKCNTCFNAELSKLTMKASLCRHGRIDVLCSDCKSDAAFEASAELKQRESETATFSVWMKAPDYNRIKMIAAFTRLLIEKERELGISS
jgi:hypothetical protein